MAGIMAASGNIENKEQFIGIAPDCELVVVKLKRYAYYEVFLEKVQILMHLYMQHQI